MGMMSGLPAPVDDCGAMDAHDPLDLLIEASGILTTSFQTGQTLAQLARLCARRLADYCAISVTAPDGESFVQASKDDSVRIEASDASSAAERLRERGLQHVVLSRISSAEGAAGWLLLASGAYAPPARLADFLALQVGNALDQSALFERTHRVATRLQRALLPERFPDLPGATLHAAYRPASAEAEVGGDWYDAFALPDGRIALSMGDVAGHGLEAATVMSELRQAMRAIAYSEDSPARVLDRVNGMLHLRSGIGMVTAIFGYYAPASRELTYAAAGHPPPILTIDGGFHGFLPGGGLPLGVDGAVQSQDWTFTLLPRSCVVFYTDGMTEYGRDVIAGEARLLDATVRAFAADSENPAIALQERIFDAKLNRDDAATMTLSCDDAPLSPSLRFSAIPLAAPIVRSALNRFCDEHRLRDSARFAIVVGAGEAVANAVEHAYCSQEIPGELYVRAAAANGIVSIEVEDRGRWRPFKPQDERGRGLLLMQEVSHGVRITSSHDRTLISLTLKP
jgi:anti-sigma regulatory factor (Ser/Thr protein kinase)